MIPQIQRPQFRRRRKLLLVRLLICLFVCLSHSHYSISAPLPPAAKKVASAKAAAAKSTGKVTPAAKKPGGKKAGPKVVTKAAPTPAAKKTKAAPKPGPKKTAKPVPKQAPKPAPKQAPKPGKKTSPKPKPAPKPPSPDNSVLTESASPQQAQNAQQRVAQLLDFLTKKGSYNTFVKLFTTTGFNDTMVSLLPFFSCTILIPDDDAFSKISAPDMKLAQAKTDGMLQLLAFHVWFPAYSAAQLQGAKPGTQYSTADYPIKGIRVFKLDTIGIMFNGREHDQIGASLIHDTMYYDQNPTQMVAHGVDRVMVPNKFF